MLRCSKRAHLRLQVNLHGSLCSCQCVVGGQPASQLRECLPLLQAAPLHRRLAAIAPICDNISGRSV